MDTPGGTWALPLMTFQPVSLPGSLPGNTSSPALVLAGEYMRFTDSSCADVRQVSASPALQSSVAGSNLQVRGSLSRPSFTPSLASQASVTALLSKANFAAGTAPAGSFKTGMATPRSQVCRCV